jgi:hypothetical protein
MISRKCISEKQIMSWPTVGLCYYNRVVFVCMCCKCIYCTWCMSTVSSCPWVHTHRSASSCCYRLQSRRMITLSSGIVLTSHSLNHIHYIVTAGQGKRVRHTQMQQHHSHLLLVLELLVLWVGRMGHQHPSPESSSWWLQNLGSFGIWCLLWI